MGLTLLNCAKFCGPTLSLHNGEAGCFWIFEFQDSLAQTVIGEIKFLMRQTEVRRSQSKHDNLNSFDWYLRALPLVQGMKS